MKKVLLILVATVSLTASHLIAKDKVDNCKGEECVANQASQVSEMRSRVAIIDLEQISKKAEVIKKIDEKIAKSREGLETKIKAAEGSMLKKEKDLRDSQSLLSKEAFEKKAQELKQESIKARDEITGEYQSIEDENLRMLKQLDNIIKEVIEDYARDKNYDLVVSKSGIAYSRKEHLDGEDISDEIAAKLNKDKRAIGIQ